MEEPERPPTQADPRKVKTNGPEIVNKPQMDSKQQNRNNGNQISNP